MSSTSTDNVALPPPYHSYMIGGGPPNMNPSLGTFELVTVPPPYPVHFESEGLNTAALPYQILETLPSSSPPPPPSFSEVLSHDTLTQEETYYNNPAPTTEPHLSSPPAYPADLQHANSQSQFENLPTINPPYSPTVPQFTVVEREGEGDDAAKKFNPIFGKEHHVKAPPGYKIMRTAKGQPFLVKEEEFEGDNQMVQNEYALVTERLSVLATWDQIEDTYGLGIRLYFDFAKSLVVMNSLLMILQASNFFTYIAFDFNKILSALSNLSYGYLTEVLYASNYSPKMVWIWRGTNVGAMLLTLGYGPIYWFLTSRSFKKRDLKDLEENFAKMDDDIIPENQGVSKFRRLLRFLGSYSIFILLLVIQLFVVAGLTFLQNFTAIYKVIGVAASGKDKIVSNQLILTPISIGISVIISIINFFWNRVCNYLTKFEKHTTWSAYRSHNTFKLLLFKLISVFIMGFAKGFFAVPCILTVLGNQYLVQIILDVTVSNIIELVLPWILFKLRRKRDKSDDSTRPEFDVAEEYLELIYRQYVVYCGMSAFPLMPFIGTFASVLELYLDKLRLLKICKKPPRTTGSIKSVVAFFLILSALLALLNWGGGGVYSLVGYYWCNRSNTIEACGQCKIFAGVRGTGFVPNLLENWNI